MHTATRRQDPVTFRRWWERAHRVAVAGGGRYLQLLVDTQFGLVAGAWDSAEAIAHHERLHDEVRRHGDPLLVFISAHCFSMVLYDAGDSERARAMAHAAIEPGRRAGPVTHTAALLGAAALDTLNGDTDPAGVAVAEAIRVARDEGLTPFVFWGVDVAAALAARRDDPETAAVLLAATSRHAGPLGCGVQGLAHRACRIEARTAIDAHPGDLTAAQRHGENMTIDELCDYTLDTLA